MLFPWISLKGKLKTLYDTCFYITFVQNSFVPTSFPSFHIMQTNALTEGFWMGSEGLSFLQR